MYTFGNANRARKLQIMPNSPIRGVFLLQLGHVMNEKSEEVKQDEIN